MEQEKKGNAVDEGRKIKRSNIPPKKQMTEEELREAVKSGWAKHEAVYKVIKDAVEKMTEQLKKPIVELISFVDDALELEITVDEETQKKNYTMKFNLTDEELEFLAIKIPTVCLFVQEHINNRALDAAIAEYLHEDAVTENLKEIVGGDAKERMRFAQQMAEVEHIVSIIKNQVYLNLKTYIDRADKIYEGVKKVLDGRNNEKKLFAKANKFSA